MTTTDKRQTTWKVPLAVFLAVQVIVVAVAVGWTGYRAIQIRSERDLPELRTTPIDVRPLFDDEVVVPDEQLVAVLRKIRPKLNGSNTVIGHVDHNLRTWSARAKFDDPQYASGEDLRSILMDHRRFAELYGPEMPPFLLDVDGGGVRVRTQEGSQSTPHFDHTLACLAETGTSLDFPVHTPRGETNVRALVEQSMRDFSLNQVEYEWSGIVFALFQANNQPWISKEGQQITFDRLARRMMREELPHGVCFGNHRLHTLTMFLRVDDQQQILSPEVRREVIGFLKAATAMLVKNQHDDGFWSRDWPTEKPTSSEPSKDDSDDLPGRIIATGHALEWWALVPADLKDELLPPRETLQRAASWLYRTVEGLTDEQVSNYQSFLSHAGRALALWRGKLPDEVDLSVAVVAPADVQPSAGQENDTDYNQPKD